MTIFNRDQQLKMRHQVCNLQTDEVTYVNLQTDKVTYVNLLTDKVTGLVLGIRGIDTVHSLFTPASRFSIREDGDAIDGWVFLLLCHTRRHTGVSCLFSDLHFGPTLTISHRPCAGEVWNEENMCVFYRPMKSGMKMGKIL